jgi:subtilisin family serine protease
MNKRIHSFFLFTIALFLFFPRLSFSEINGEIKAQIENISQAIIERSGINSDVIILADTGTSEGGQLTEVIKHPSQIVRTMWSSIKGLTLNVGVLGANSTEKLNDVQEKLIQSNQFASVTMINVSLITPTLSELNVFDSILIHANKSYADSELLGNVLADYVDSGKGVVSAMFEIANVNNNKQSMQGRWHTEKYYIVSPTNRMIGPKATLGKIHDPDHPIMQGVKTFDGGEMSFRPTSINLTSGAEIIAEWSDGKPLVVIKNINQIPRVDLCFYPPSSDVRKDFWDVSTDGTKLLANSLIWVSETQNQPKLHLDRTEINAQLSEGETTQISITLSNIGNTDLNYSAGDSKNALNENNSDVTTSSDSPVINEIPDGVAISDDTILVKLKPSVFRKRSVRLNEIVNASVTDRIPSLDLEVWQLPLSRKRVRQDVLDIISQLSQNPDIVYAQPIFTNYEAIGLPDDPKFSELWGLHNTGQTDGRNNADINAPEAWDIFTGNAEIVVAVIDTGVDYNHEDLKDNIWINADEIPGNGIDDDNNGFTDDTHGYDFAYNDADPMDGNRHGTHCAGTIGAVANNQKGVAGVTHHVRIMPVKFLKDNGFGSTVDAIKSVLYAVDNGADILSNSWGGGSFDPALKDAISYAHKKNVLFVAAAGNNYQNNNDIIPVYPSCYDVENVISVAATDHNDDLAVFSNIGLKTVDLGAPGKDILSSIPNNKYACLSGTSMATPHVSGAAALLKGYNPELSNVQIKKLLMDNVDPIDALSGKTVTGGRLNLVKSLMASPDKQWINLKGDIAGTIKPGESRIITVELDATSLSGGNYQSNITIESNDPLNPLIRIPVILNVLARPSYVIQLNKIGSGQIFLDGKCIETPWTGEFRDGQRINLEAIPDKDSSFSYWGGSIVDSNNPIDLDINGDMSVVAHFDLPYWELMLTADGARITEFDSNALSGDVSTFVSSMDAIIGIDETDSLIEQYPLPPMASVSLRLISKDIAYSYYKYIQGRDGDFYQWIVGIHPLGNMRSSVPRTATLHWDASLLPDGYFRLCKGYEGNGSTIIEDMRKTNQLEVTGKEEQFFTIQYSQKPFTQKTHDLELKAGWNLISLPVKPDDPKLKILFPDAIVAYGFSDRFYLISPSDDLVPGNGYWIKVPQARTYPLKGAPFLQYISAFPEDWHLIGTVCGDKPIFPEPIGDIIVAYGFDESYFLAKELKCGMGYWIKIEAGGSMLQMNAQ